MNLISRRFKYILVLLLALVPICARAGVVVSLDGTWDFQMDPSDIGKTAGWYLPGTAYASHMAVPGCWNAGGAGTQSENLFHSFPGPAWYHRKVTLGHEAQGKVIWLRFGGVHRYADVWVNGQFVGSHIAYPVPFKFDISKFLGEDYSVDIAVRVDARQNREIDPLYGCFDVMDMGPLSWGGMYRGVQIEMTSTTWIESVHVVPQLSTSEAVVTTEVGSSVKRTTPLDVTVEVYDARGRDVGNANATIPADHSSATARVEMKNVETWSPQHPYLYTVDARIRSGNEELDVKTDRFGMREIGTSGKDFVLNGRPIFLRGYGDDCIFPNTFAPPADKAEYYRRFKMAKDYGFNYVRHHSWTPLDEYFDVADELGIMLQPEFPIAYGNNYDPGTPERKQLYLDTWREIIKANWNHPSIITWDMGNELSGGIDLAPEMYKIAKDMDPTRLVIDTDGIEVPKPGDQVRPTLDFFTPGFDELRLFGLNDNKYPSDLKPAKPLLLHEMGNFATLPSLTQIGLFRDGVRPFWLYKLSDLVSKAGVAKEYPGWVANSNKLQAAVLKTNIESARRSLSVSGYHQWLFQDYWNGSNGVVDMFYRPKASTAAYFRKFNSPTVLLMDSPKRSFWSGETARIQLLVSRYEDQPVNDAALSWELRDGAKLVSSGRSKGLKVNDNGVQPLRSIAVRMPSTIVARKLTLVVVLEDGNGKRTNDWNLWVYPTVRFKPDNIAVRSEGSLDIRKLFPGIKEAEGNLSACRLLITSQPSERDFSYLEHGGRALLLNVAGVFPTTPSSYRSCWWLGDVGADSNTGTVIDMRHPLMRGLPNEGWCDVNFANLLTGSSAILLNDLPVKVQPIIRCLDVHAVLRDKGYIIEMNVGKGKLLACSMNFRKALYKRDPAAIFLLDQLIRYASGPDFKPAANLPASYLHGRTAPEKSDSVQRPERAPRINGFARIKVSQGEEMCYYSYRDPSRRAWVVRPTDGKQRIEWLSSPVRISKPGRISLVWTAAVGYMSERDGSFTLSLNGKPLLDFGVTLQSHRWLSSDGKVELFFDAKEHTGEDSFGVMYVTLSSSLLRNNTPARLAISASNSGSRRWFMLFDYRDTLDFED